jgi:hypothetical protein
MSLKKIEGTGTPALQDIPRKNEQGELAQLARAPALHAGGHRFDSDILHDYPPEPRRKRAFVQRN